MSGIAGLVRFDGQTINDVEINTITNLLKHRGNVTSQRIGNTLLLAFGGSIEKNPIMPVYAAVDADIFDNVTENYPFTNRYVQAGPASFDKLNADFAIALWDDNQQAIYCARDPMGTKPLYYVFQPGRFFAFSSEIKALLTLHDVTVRPNYHKLREYLTWTTTYLPYSTETFYESVYSVLPSHYLQVNAQKAVEHPYWQPNLTQYKSLITIDDYSTVFREHFSNAIDSRIKDKERVGSHLSGGLDSSSVSCVAQQLLMKQHRSSLYTFNIDTQQPFAEEQKYVQAVVDQWHTYHQKVHPIADVLDSVQKINTIFDQPEQFIIPSSFHLSVSLEAKRLGCDILLTGHDGDSVITTGFDFLENLADADNWDDFNQAARQFLTPTERNFNYVHPNWSQLTAHEKYEKYVLWMIGRKLKKQLHNQPLRTVLAKLLQHKKRFGLSDKAILTHAYQRISNKIASRSALDNALTEDFKRQTQPRTKTSTKKLVKDLSEANNVAFEEVLNHTNVICNEQMNHIGAYYGHQYSFPFFDKKVIELGLATPQAIRFDNGHGRGLIRHGLRNVLPPPVLERVTKANFVEYGTLSANQLYDVFHEQFSSKSHPIWEIVDRNRLSKIVEIVQSSRFPVWQKTRYNWLLSRIIYLSLWLDTLNK